MIRLVKRYVLDAQLGQGGMGTVFKGKDLQTGEWVAAKRLRPEALDANPDILERFIREGEALRRLNHPNIVKMLAAVEDEGDHYLILEYVPGGDLGDLLKTKGRLSVGRTLQIGIELADALTRAHYLKIIHRDLKPANVLLDTDGTPKLTDFGVAHIGTQQGITGAGLAMGTPDYMAPEAVNGDEVDERADIWSMGVMLFELLTGQHPFRAEMLTTTLINIVLQPVPDLEAMQPDIPVALIDLIYRMMAKDREARISSIRVVGAELEAIIRGVPDIKRTTSTAMSPAITADAVTMRFQTPTPRSSEVRHNLPAQSTPFVGREAELAEVMRLVSEGRARLVTILGPGGMGKTRLAIQAAETLAAGYPDGVYFFSLAQLSSMDGIGSLLMDTLGMTPMEDGRTPFQQLLDHLRPKRALLIFDNFEHLVAGATLVGEINQAAPDVRVIATSRERLNLSGETIYALTGMDIPDFRSVEEALRYSAVQLWLQSARRANPNYELKDGDLSAVRRIGRKVDGLPLGIILAASWADNLSAHEIAAEIDRSLDFLESELRDLPERHRSMRAVFEYSYALLPENERDTFLKLAVFTGGFTRDAAQTVSGATLRCITGLQNKSLIKRSPDTGRYEMHELVREYAHEKLHQLPGGDEAVHDLHSAYYCDFLAKRMTALYGADELSTLADIEAERGNIRESWVWASSNGQTERVEQALPTLALVFESKGYFREGEQSFGDLAEGLAQHYPADFPLLCRVRVYRALMLAHLGDYGRPRAEVEAVLQIYRKRQARGLAAADDVPDRSGHFTAYKSFTHDLGMALNVLGHIAMNQGQYQDALEYLDEAGRLFHEAKFRPMEARTQGTLAYTYFLMGEREKAQAVYEPLLEQYRVMKMDTPAAQIANNLGEVLHALMDDDRAAELFELALVTYTKLKNQRGQAVALLNLGTVFHSRAQYGKAEEYNRRALALFQEIGDQHGIADALNRLGGTVYWFGHYREAMEMYRQAYDIFRRIGNPKGAADALVLRALASNAAGDYASGESDLNAAFELRGQMGNPAEIADVQQVLGINRMQAGDIDSAFFWLEQAADVAAQIDPPDIGLNTRYQMLKAIVLLTAKRYEESVALIEPLLPTFEKYQVWWARVQIYAALGFGYWNTGRHGEAKHVFYRSVEIAARIAARDWGAFAMLGCGLVLAEHGDPLRALEIFYFVKQYPTTHEFMRVYADEFIQQITAEHPAQVSDGELAAARARAALLNYDDVVAALVGHAVETPQ